MGTFSGNMPLKIFFTINKMKYNMKNISKKGSVYTDIFNFNKTRSISLIQHYNTTMGGEVEVLEYKLKK